MIGKLILVVLTATAVAGLTCPDPDVCSCDETVVECVCTDREDLNVTLLLQFQAQHMMIRGCGSVFLHSVALVHMALDTFIIDDVNYLEIRRFAFGGTEYVSSVTFSNIGLMDIEPHAFKGLTNVTEIILRNVSAISIGPSSFNQISFADRFVIDNCVFGKIESTAFVIHNAESFEMTNTEIKDLETASTILHKVNTITFFNNTFHNVLFRSLVFITVETVNITKCDIENVHRDFVLSKDIEQMIVQKSSFRSIGAYAMTKADVMHDFILYDNFFEIAEDYSLLPNATDDLIIDVKKNKFICNCDLLWLWKTEDFIYGDIMENNYCQGPILQKLSSMSPIFDSQGQCLRISSNLQFKSTTLRKHVDSFEEISSKKLESSNMSLYASAFLIFVLNIVMQSFTHVIT